MEQTNYESKKIVCLSCVCYKSTTRIINAMDNQAYKYIMFVFAALFMLSCNNDVDEIGDFGYHLSFNCITADSLQVFENDYSPYVLDTTFADLHLRLMDSTSKNGNGERIEKIEHQISLFLDPKGDKYNGDMPIPVKYTTVECKSISIILYDGNNNLVGDITDKARFHFVGDPYDSSEDGLNIVIGADSLLVGKLDKGATIKDYLALCPMMFAEAHFIFPDLNKEIFEMGYHANIEIKLGNDKTLKAYSRNEHRFKE